MRAAGHIWSRYKLDKVAADAKSGAITFIKLGCLMRCVRQYGIDMTLCVGPSMLPTFNERGDLVLLEHYSVYSEKIKPGDVVVARSAQTPRYFVCKRVLGLEGDIIKVTPPHGTDKPHVTVVPKGHVWLQGDNLINSTDSRLYGPVPYNMLLGRVFLKVWPLHESGWVERKAPVATGSSFF